MRRALRQLSPILLTGLLLPAVAVAEPEPRGETVTVTVSPVHLVLPVVEAQIEYYASELISVAILGGGGTITTELSDGESVTFDVLEVGGQARAYFYGSSEGGAHAGVEVMYVKLDGDVDGVTGVGSGLAGGAIAGYKWVFGPGFVLDLNGGIGFGRVDAEATDGDETETKSETQALPIININIGWAF